MQSADKFSKNLKLSLEDTSQVKQELQKSLEKLTALGHDKVSAVGIISDELRLVKTRNCQHFNANLSATTSSKTLTH